MNDDENDLEELLAPLRNGPVALSSAADTAARKLRLLPKVRSAVQAVPDRLQRARRRGALLWSATAMAAAALLGVGIAHNTAPASGVDSDTARALAGASSQEPQAQVGELRVDPLGHESAAWIDAAGSRRPIHASAALEGSGELVAAAGSWSRLSTPQGVRVELAPRTRLRVRSAARSLVGAQLNLVEGEVRCQVPKLGKSAHFEIETADARVIVHGTRFSVHVGTPDRPGTCVHVSEGLVEVQHDGTSTMLTRGAQWGCEPEQPAVASASSARTIVTAPIVAAAAAVEPLRTAVSVHEPVLASARPARGNARHAKRTTRSQRASRAGSETVAVAETKPAVEPKPTAVTKPALSKPASEPVAAVARPAASGTLGEENHLLGAALSAERSGDRDRARVLFEALIAQNPGSPLAPEARMGLSRVH